MIFSKLWSRWIFKDVMKFLLFFILCCYFIFFTVDLSFHGSKILFKSSAGIVNVLIYYYHNFIIHLNLFLSLAFMLSLIKVITSLNIHNELIALQMSGLSKFKLSLPIFLIAFFITALCYINYEYLIPGSTEKIEDFKNQFFRIGKKTEKNLVNTVFLENGTKIIYQKYDMEKDKLFDLFFIKSKSDIWHAKYLDPNSVPVEGNFVDHFEIDNEGKLQKKESYASYFFTEINFDKIANDSLQPYDARPVSSLLSQYLSNRYASSIEKAHSLSQLNYKLALPLLPILLVFALLPVSSKFSRSNLTYIIFSLALILFIGFHTLMDSVLILSENRVASPFLLIWTPVALSFFFFGFKFIKGN